MERLGLLAFLSALATASVTPALAQDLLWARQFGSALDDYTGGVSVDGAGNVYVSGSIFRDAGDWDALLAKYDASGTQLWTRQFGGPGTHYAYDVAVDGVGNVYTTGSTTGNLGGTNAGSSDVFLAKYDATGALLWTRQLGTKGDEEGWGVAVDGAGNAYVAGWTNGNLAGTNAGINDAFLAKFDSSGTPLWTRQIGTPENNLCYGLGVDGVGNAYITVYTSLGTSGESDVFLYKYNTSGIPLWTRQIDDGASSVAVDGVGNAYVAGYTGGSDALLAKYDASGTPLWMRQIGTSSIDSAVSVALDSAGDAYIAGFTYGSLGGTSAGGADAFVVKYDASGALLWRRQIGTSSDDDSSGLSVDGTGNVYITGGTLGSLGGGNAGGSDLFLAKFTCPSDFDRNGFVNGDDFDSFVLVFISGDAAADFDGNGFVNGDDFDGYVAAFEAGC